MHTYGLNINSTLAFIWGLAIRLSVEGLKVFGLLGVSEDPVRVRVHGEELEKGTRLPSVESFLQKALFFFCVLTINLS